jgi:ferrous iron transport protein B
MSDSGSCHEAAPPTGNRTTGHYVALVGPPNAGKSTLFNRLTGLRQKVANFPGVTVEHHVGRVKDSTGQDLFVIDLPGIYSLTPRSEDEQVTYDVLTGAKDSLGLPDGIILILDSTNLQRHLVLAAPVLALGLPTLVVLNMADDLEARGGKVDPAALAREIGAPVALISAASGAGVERVVQFLHGTGARPAAPQPRFELPVLPNLPARRRWAGRVGLQAGYTPPAPPEWTRRLDRVFLHPVFGPLIFLIVVLAVFQGIFTGAQPMMDGVEGLISWSGERIGNFLPEGILRSLLVEGVWGGVGSVVVFLPQILLLFLFIGILEDSGYLARAAVIADRTMSRVGLQGKAFIPLLSAYACAVPAIMATRTIENKRDRLATVLIAPFMTCSARLPVYTLLIAAFVPNTPIVGQLLGLQAAVLLGLYLLGFAAAVGTALLLRSTVLRHEKTTFVMELPAYRRPSFRSLLLRLIDRAIIFLKRAGTVILTVTIVLWILAHLPYKDGKPPAIEDSIAGQIGRAVEPAIQPLGFNWKIGIGLITSLAAREVIVGTLGTIYGIENAEQDSPPLIESLRKDLTPGGAFALMIFFAFAMQCFSTVAIVRRELGSWTWPAVQFAYMGLLAYVGALATNQIWLAFR